MATIEVHDAHGVTLFSLWCCAGSCCVPTAGVGCRTAISHIHMRSAFTLNQLPSEAFLAKGLSSKLLSVPAAAGA